MLLHDATHFCMLPKAKGCAIKDPFGDKLVSLKIKESEVSVISAGNCDMKSKCSGKKSVSRFFPRYQAIGNKTDKMTTHVYCYRKLQMRFSWGREQRSRGHCTIQDFQFCLVKIPLFLIIKNNNNKIYSSQVT